LPGIECENQCTGSLTRFISSFDFLPFFFLDTEGQHANTNALEAIDHLTSFVSSREEISQPGIEPPLTQYQFCSYITHSPGFDASKFFFSFGFLLPSLPLPWESLQSPDAIAHAGQDILRFGATKQLAIINSKHTKQGVSLSSVTASPSE
jgi:hypothetical protein